MAGRNSPTIPCSTKCGYCTRPDSRHLGAILRPATGPRGRERVYHWLVFDHPFLCDKTSEGAEADHPHHLHSWTGRLSWSAPVPAPLGEPYRWSHTGCACGRQMGPNSLEVKTTRKRLILGSKSGLT